MLSMESKKDSVREETSVVSGTMKTSVEKPTQEVEVSRGTRASEAGVHVESSLDSRAKTT